MVPSILTIFCPPSGQPQSYSEDGHTLSPVSSSTTDLCSMRSGDLKYVRLAMLIGDCNADWTALATQDPLANPDLLLL